MLNPSFYPPPPPFPSSAMLKWQPNNLVLLFDSKECSCSTHIFQCKFLHQKPRKWWDWNEVSCIGFFHKTIFIFFTTIFSAFIILPFWDKFIFISFSVLFVHLSFYCKLYLLDIVCLSISNCICLWQIYNWLLLC